MPFTRVPGRDLGKKVIFFALSTCAWCKKTKEALDEAGIDYEYIFVDLAPDDEWQQVRDMMKKLNPRGSYPVVAVGTDVVVGYDPEKLQELIGAKT